MDHTKDHRRGGNPGGGKKDVHCMGGFERSPSNITASRNQAPLSRSHPLAVYDGRECIGFIKPHAGGFDALDLDRKSLGTFPTRGAAADALEDISGAIMTSVIRFPTRARHDHDRVPEHDHRLWMLASEIFALRLGELNHAGRRALVAKIAKGSGSTMDVLRAIHGDGGNA